MAYGVMAFIFASTTPLGIVIGLAIQTTYDAESPKALILAGVFDAISAGKPHPPHALWCQCCSACFLASWCMPCCPISFASKGHAVIS